MLPSRSHRLDVVKLPRPVRSAPESRRNSLTHHHQENTEDRTGEKTHAATVRTPRTTSLPNCSSPRPSLAQEDHPCSGNGRAAKEAGGFLSFRSSSSPEPCTTSTTTTSPITASPSPITASPSPLRHHNSLESAALARDFFGQRQQQNCGMPTARLLQVPAVLSDRETSPRSRRTSCPRKAMTESPLLRRQSNVQSVMDSIVTLPSPVVTRPHSPLVLTAPQTDRCTSSPSPVSCRPIHLLNSVPDLSSSGVGGGGGCWDPPSPSSYFRVVVLGEEGVGKSTLVRQLSSGANRCQHVGDTKCGNVEEDEDSDRVILHLDRKDEHCTLEIFDSPLNANIDSLRPDAFIVIYSVSDRKSYVTAKEVTRHLRYELGMDRPIFIVGNKMDLRRQQKVSAKEAKQASETFDCSFLQTSAALRLNVEKLLFTMVDSITEQLLPPEGSIMSHDLCLSRPKASSSGKALQFFSKLLRQALFKRSFSSDSFCLKL